MAYFKPGEPVIKGTSKVGSNLPAEVNNLAQALMQRHGSILVSREKNGLHINMACPDCLERDGSSELRKRHFALNADKYLMSGRWEDSDLPPGVRNKACQCMKCGMRAKVSELLKWATLEERGIKLSKTGKVNFVDNTAWLVDDGRGNIIPGGPGDGSPDSVIPITELSQDHPAVEYLLRRDYNLSSLWEQFRCSYCAKEWPMDPTAGRFYRRMPEGFLDSPQGRIIFFCDMGGVQKSWQARIIDREFTHDGRRYKAYWNGHRNQWFTMELFDDKAGKFKPLPQYANELNDWSPRKYRNANGASRNEVLFGLDAAVRWNRQHRPNQLPVAFSLEGPLDAGRFGPPALAKTGKFTSDDQVEIMSRFFSIMVEVPDNDKAGREALQDTWMRMEQKMTTHVWELPEKMAVVDHFIKDAGDLPDYLAQIMKTAYLSKL